MKHKPLKRSSRSQQQAPPTKKGEPLQIRTISLPASDPELKPTVRLLSTEEARMLDQFREDS